MHSRTGFFVLIAKMKVTINIKLINSEFDQDIALALHNGEESEENIKYLWEDEFEVQGEVESFKVRNNVVFQLEGYLANNTKFSYEIPDMTIVECTTKDGKVNQFPISKRLIKSTEKKEDSKTKNIHFYVVLTDRYEHVNPMDGTYIIKTDFPKDLL